MSNDRSPIPGPVTLTFLGGAGTVTGSRYLLEHAGSRTLVDCGLYQGERELRRRNWQPFPVDPRTIDVVVLTHAHLDHTGFLPKLARNGFSGPVLCSPMTARLADIVLLDAAHLQEEDARYARQAGFSRHEPPLPLFDTTDAQHALRLIRPIEFGADFPLPDGCLRLQPAGHILGSAFVEFHLGGTKVTFSGDLGRDHHPLLRGPTRPAPADALIIESTYGDRHHPPDPEVVLAAAINRTITRGGVALLPAFAVDRTALLLHVIAVLIQQGRIPDVPVHVDSPMALAALRVYRDAMEHHDRQFRPAVLDGRLPLTPPQLRLAAGVSESVALNQPAHPCVVISASGMATGGRVLHHLKAQLPQRRNSVILTGYQVPGTRGRTLASGAPSVKIHGRYVPVHAEVVTVDGFSAHADSDELRSWATAIPPPATTFVVHGEGRASAELARRLITETGRTAVVPRLGERVRLDH